MPYRSSAGAEEEDTGGSARVGEGHHEQEEEGLGLQHLQYTLELREEEEEEEAAAAALSPTRIKESALILVAGASPTPTEQHAPSLDRDQDSPPLEPYPPSLPDMDQKPSTPGSSHIRSIIPSPRIPQEIIDMTIDRIWDEPDELDFWSNYGDEYHALCTTALVSRSLLPRARYNLLKRVSLLKMEHLQSFTAMIFIYPESGPMVLDLVILSTPQKPSPAESFAPMLAGLLPTLQSLRIRTEIDPVEDLDLRPTLAFHRAAIASLSRFKTVTILQLFGLRFANFSDFLRLLTALPGLVTLQCMQIWFCNSARHQRSSIRATRPLQLETLDLAFIPRSAMRGVINAVQRGRMTELIITTNRTGSIEETEETFACLIEFDNLQSFTFFVAVTEKGAEYTDLVGFLSLLNPCINTIIVSHYLHGPARNHVVPKQTMLDSVSRNAEMLQEALDPRKFPAKTRVVFEFQGFHDSEGWWAQRVRPILPKLCADDRGEYFTIQNVTYSDWSPWLDDKDLSTDA